MALITCPDCGKGFSDLAPACPGCGRPNAGAPVPTQRVGCALSLGIFLFPLIFAWFTLQKGYTHGARLVAFLWLAVSSLFGLMFWWAIVGPLLAVATAGA